jgi:hypothetical protein
VDVIRVFVTWLTDGVPADPAWHRNIPNSLSVDNATEGENSVKRECHHL